MENILAMMDSSHQPENLQASLASLSTARALRDLLSQERRDVTLGSLGGGFGGRTLAWESTSIQYV